MARLIIYEKIDGTDTVFETFQLQENRITIGSDDDNHLILESPHVDLMHASLELRENLHWFLQDLGGINGTGVNGQLIEGPYMLHHNDVIELGVIKMRFQTDDERGITEEFQTQAQSGSVAADGPANVKAASPEAQLSGRVWFASLVVATSAVIFLILLLFAAGHFFGVLDVMDLLPGG